MGVQYAVRETEQTDERTPEMEIYLFFLEVAGYGRTESNDTYVRNGDPVRIGPYGRRVFLLT